MIVTARFQFRASHSLEAPAHKRAEVGDLCGVLHGHEYLVEVSLKSPEIDSISGLSPTRSLFKDLETAVFRPLKNIHLNDHFLFTSGEYLCRQIYELCKKTLPDAQIVNVAIQETSKNRFEVVEDLA